MNGISEELLALWREEEAAAIMRGWDFAHIERRSSEDDRLTWDYRALAAQWVRPEHRLLDMDTGGGEFLLSLGHPAPRTAATEGYPPNAALCRQRLTPLGIDFREASGGRIPFEDAAFDRVLNRHGSFDIAELWRALRPGGVFLTQQVGEDNDRTLVQLLLPGTPKPFPGMNMATQAEAFRAAGFEILRAEECFGALRFTDVGALVWFARVTPWEFPGFCVDACLPGLAAAQRQIEQQGFVEGQTHRYLIIARKPEG